MYYSNFWYNFHYNLCIQFSGDWQRPSQVSSSLWSYDWCGAAVGGPPQQTIYSVPDGPDPTSCSVIIHFIVH